jgi:crossover junction endodeoxyribonuclease RuvC
MASRPSHILSIDPGLSGALALLNTQSKAIVALYDTPVSDGRVDPAKLAAIVRTALFLADGSLHAAVELVSSMPRQAGAFNFGVSTGVVHGVLSALGVPMTLVSPGVWKSSMGLRKLPGEDQAGTKTRARELATKLWPERTADFKRVMDSDRAEAALIARHFINSKGW